MFHVVTNCCRHGPLRYPYETHNLEQYLCYESQMISTSCFLQQNGCSNCWHWLSSCTCIFKWPYDIRIFKRIKTFLINVTCLFFQQFGVPKVHACMIILSVDARLYISNWTAAVSVHVFGSRYMYMYFEKVNIFLYIMQHLDTSGTS